MKATLARLQTEKQYYMNLEKEKKVLSMVK